MDTLSLSRREVHRLIHQTLDNPTKHFDGSFKLTRQEFKKVVNAGEMITPPLKIVYVHTHTVWEIYESKMNYMDVGDWIKEEA